ncbi:RHS repeat domain-containing protein [Pseudomonas purpurea]
MLAFKDLRFSYDTWGNLSEKTSASGAMQRFHYDSENRLIHAQTWQGTTLSSEGPLPVRRRRPTHRQTGHPKRANPTHPLALARRLRLPQEQHTERRNLA